MRRAARACDDAFQAIVGGGCGKFNQPAGGPVGGDDFAIMGYFQRRQYVRRALHRFPIRLAAHDDADQNLRFIHDDAPITRRCPDVQKLDYISGLPKKCSEQWLILGGFIAERPCLRCRYNRLPNIT